MTTPSFEEMCWLVIQVMPHLKPVMREKFISFYYYVVLYKMIILILGIAWAAGIASCHFRKSKYDN